ncbi:MAG: hypothetical protein WKF75_00010 [Singulisphaera sp.]
MLESLIRGLAEARRTILCSRPAGDAMTILAFHLGPDGLVLRRNLDGLVSDSTVLAGPGDAADFAADFYGAPEKVTGNLTPIRLRRESVLEILGSRQRTLITERLSRVRIPAEIRPALIDDLLEPRLRGSVVRMDQRKDGTSTTERRLSLLGGGLRLWLLRPVITGPGPLVEFSLASKVVLRDAILQVVREAAS